MRIILCLFILSGTNKIYSQNNVISLPNLLQRLSQEYPTIKAKEASIKAASYRVQSARKDYLPELIIADQHQFSTNIGLEGSYYSNGGTAISIGLVAVAGGRKHFVNMQEGMKTKDSTEVFGKLKGIATVIKHPSTEVEEGVPVE